MPYHIAVQVMRPVSVDELLGDIQHNSRISFSVGRELVLKSFKAGPDDILEMKKKVALQDPLVLTRIQVPCKAKTCKHVQCFDMKNFLLMNERVRYVSSDRLVHSRHTDALTLP